MSSRSAYATVCVAVIAIVTLLAVMLGLWARYYLGPEASRADWQAPGVVVAV